MKTLNHITATFGLVAALLLGGTGCLVDSVSSIECETDETYCGFTCRPTVTMSIGGVVAELEFTGNSPAPSAPVEMILVDALGAPLLCDGDPCAALIDPASNATGEFFFRDLNATCVTPAVMAILDDASTSSQDVYAHTQMPIAGGFPTCDLTTQAQIMTHASLAQLAGMMGRDAADDLEAEGATLIIVLDATQTPVVGERASMNNPAVDLKYIDPINSRATETSAFGMIYVTNSPLINRTPNVMTLVPGVGYEPTPVVTTPGTISLQPFVPYDLPDAACTPFCPDGETDCGNGCEPEINCSSACPSGQTECSDGCQTSVLATLSGTVSDWTGGAPTSDVSVNVVSTLTDVGAPMASVTVSAGNTAFELVDADVTCWPSIFGNEAGASLLVDDPAGGADVYAATITNIGQGAPTDATGLAVTGVSNATVATIEGLFSTAPGMLAAGAALVTVIDPLGDPAAGVTAAANGTGTIGYPQLDASSQDGAETDASGAILITAAPPAIAVPSFDFTPDSAATYTFQQMQAVTYPGYIDARSIFGIPAGGCAFGQIDCGGGAGCEPEVMLNLSGFVTDFLGRTPPATEVTVSLATLDPTSPGVPASLGNATVTAGSGTYSFTDLDVTCVPAGHIMLASIGGAGHITTNFPVSATVLSGTVANLPLQVVSLADAGAIDGLTGTAINTTGAFLVPVLDGAMMPLPEAMATGAATISYPDFGAPGAGSDTDGSGIIVITEAGNLGTGAFDIISIDPSGSYAPDLTYAPIAALTIPATITISPAVPTGTTNGCSLTQKLCSTTCTEIKMVGGYFSSTVTASQPTVAVPVTAWLQSAPPLAGAAESDFLIPANSGPSARPIYDVTCDDPMDPTVFVSNVSAVTGDAPSTEHMTTLFAASASVPVGVPTVPIQVMSLSDLDILNQVVNGFDCASAAETPCGAQTGKCSWSGSACEYVIDVETAGSVIVLLLDATGAPVSGATVTSTFGASDTVAYYPQLASGTSNGAATDASGMVLLTSAGGAGIGELEIFTVSGGSETWGVFAGTGVVGMSMITIVPHLADP